MNDTEIQAGSICTSCGALWPRVYMCCPRCGIVLTSTTRVKELGMNLNIRFDPRFKDAVWPREPESQHI